MRNFSLKLQETMNRPKLLWHAGFYDFPLNGVAEYEGRKVWFEADEDLYYENIQKYELKDVSTNSDEECDEECMLYYDLYDIPADVMQDIVDSHKIFQEMVGYHCDHDPSVYQPCVKPYTEFILYYDDNTLKKICSPPKGTSMTKITRISSDNFEWYGRYLYAC